MWRFDDAEIYEIGCLSVAKEELPDQSWVEWGVSLELESLGRHVWFLQVVMILINNKWQSVMRSLIRIHYSSWIKGLSLKEDMSLWQTVTLYVISSVQRLKWGAHCQVGEIESFGEERGKMVLGLKVELRTDAINNSYLHGPVAARRQIIYCPSWASRCTAFKGQLHYILQYFVKLYMLFVQNELHMRGRNQLQNPKKQTIVLISSVSV